MTHLPHRRAALKAAALTALAGLVGCDQTEVPPGLVAPPKPDAPPAPSKPPETPRAKAVREAAEAIRAECQRNAGGDWAKWQQQTAAYRDAVKVRLEAAKPFNPTADSPYYESRDRVLAPIDDFPLIECGSHHYLQYLLEPDTIAKAHADKPIVAAKNWLGKRGIDLVVVDVPKLLEVYPQHFTANCPADHIVAPHRRKFVLDLLESDVEVVDTLPRMLAVPESPQDLLYLAADPHWGPLGYQLGAKATADHLKRYPFVAEALAGPPAVKAVTVPFPPLSSGAPFCGVAYGGLTPEQKAKAEAVHPKMLTRTLTPDGKEALSEKSPVLVIGNSFTSGFAEALSREINLPLHVRAGGGNSTEAFADFLREPELLQHAKVVVWVVSSQQLNYFKPLPKPVQDAIH